MPEFTAAKDIARQIPEDATCVLLGECTHGTEVMKPPLKTTTCLVKKKSNASDVLTVVYRLL